ncbi:uncharacterized protein LOC134220260 isoform X2 [Armigeres subalbatus]|uniref:uncharacterized protein LOC134220260 isoform X2 n=1 Tax=Armigeres subalbatus TaxID=124917 RepID=UPI002ED6ACBB
MISLRLSIIAAVTLCLPATLSVPIFWFPWNYFLPTTTTSGSAASSSSSSSTLRPIMANIAIGNRLNTSAMTDNGTIINGLTITRGRRAVPLTPVPVPGDPSVTSESFIQVGNHIIRLPPGNVANLTINIVDGVPNVFGNVGTDVSDGANGSTSGLFAQLGNFFGGLFGGGTPNAN